MNEEQEKTKVEGYPQVYWRKRKTKIVDDRENREEE